MPAPKKSAASYIAKQIAKKASKKASKKALKSVSKTTIAKPKSNVKVTNPKMGPLTAKQTEAKRISDAKYRMIKVKNPRPRFDD